MAKTYPFANAKTGTAQKGTRSSTHPVMASKKGTRHRVTSQRRGPPSKAMPHLKG